MNTFYIYSWLTYKLYYFRNVVKNDPFSNRLNCLQISNKLQCFLKIEINEHPNSYTILEYLQSAYICYTTVLYKKFNRLSVFEKKLQMISNAFFMCLK